MEKYDKHKDSGVEWLGGRYLKCAAEFNYLQLLFTGSKGAFT